MTHKEAAIKLFQHGPLSAKEFISISGWGEKQSQNILSELFLDGKLNRIKRGVYELNQSKLITTQVLLTIKHTREIPDLTDLIADRVYRMDKVEDVTAERLDLVKLPVVVEMKGE